MVGIATKPEKGPRGGFTAVIWTDSIQVTAYLCGTLLALVFALHSIPGGWSDVVRLAAMYGHKLTVLNFSFNWHQPYLFWPGLIGGTFLMTASHGTDQLIVQRLLAARTMRQSQAAILSSGLVILFQVALFLVMGIVLFAFYHHFPPAAAFGRADRIFPAFVVTRLPIGFAGFLTAAILAAAMSNLSASFNSLASSSMVDFYKPLVRPKADEKHYLRASRLMTLGWGGVLIIIALLARFLHESVLEFALTTASVPHGAMLGIFLLAILTSRASSRGALAGAIAALAIVCGVMSANALHVISIAWTWYVVIGTLVTFAGGYAASFFWRNVRTNA